MGRRNKDLTSGNIKNHLFKLSWPMLFGMVGIVIFHLADTFFVGQLGVPFVVFPMIGNHIVRATGDTFTPGMIMLASAAVNIILDPLLIFGIGPFPELGIRGAVLATVSARSSSFVVILVILIFLGRSIAGIFSDDRLVVNVARKYFLIVGASYGFQGIVMLCNSGFNGINKPYPATILAIIRMLILFVPLAWLGSKLFGLTGIFFAGLTANVVIGILSSTYLKKTIKQLQKSKT